MKTRADDRRGETNLFPQLVHQRTFKSIVCKFSHLYYVVSIASALRSLTRGSIGYVTIKQEMVSAPLLENPGRNKGSRQKVSVTIKHLGLLDLMRKFKDAISEANVMHYYEISGSVA